MASRNTISIPSTLGTLMGASIYDRAVQAYATNNTNLVVVDDAFIDTYTATSWALKLGALQRAQAGRRGHPYYRTGCWVKTADVEVKIA